MSAAKHNKRCHSLLQPIIKRLLATSVPKIPQITEYSKSGFPREAISPDFLHFN